MDDVNEQQLCLCLTASMDSNRKCCFCAEKDQNGEAIEGFPDMPRDCYRFLSMGWKGANIIPFVYASIVVVFQLGFLSFMITSKLIPSASTNDDVDNPIGTWIEVFPSDVTGIVRATQLFALFGFLFFEDSSLNDFRNGFALVRHRKDTNSEDTKNTPLQGVANVLRMTQGFLACITVFILVMTSNDVIDIILNFTAVNFISDLDDQAFDLAQSGKYGPILKLAADDADAFVAFLEGTGSETKTSAQIYEEKMKESEEEWKKLEAKFVQLKEKVATLFPEWVLHALKKCKRNESSELKGSTRNGRISIAEDPKDQKEKDKTFSNNYFHATWLAFGFIALIFFVCLLAVLVCQAQPNLWSTLTVKVNFEESSGKLMFSGCYETMETEYHGRLVYKNEKSSTLLAYCKDKKNADVTRQWVFLTDTMDHDVDPCFAQSNFREVAHSAQTTTFDVSSAFELQWFGPDGVPLDAKFSSVDDDSDKVMKCDLFSRDGRCVEDFNSILYSFDGGDCCASTCTKDPLNTKSCELQRFSTSMFGVEEVEVEGFPSCKDPAMVPVIISLTQTPSFEMPLGWNETVSESTVWKPVLNLNCDNGKAVFTVPLSTQMKPGDASIGEVEEDSNCTLNVENSLFWNMDVYGSVSGREIATKYDNVIPTEIGLLKDLTILSMSGMGLTGTIPFEIGEMQKLTSLDLSDNNLEGSIPSDQLEKLENLVFIDLGAPHTNVNLTGAIDCTKFNVEYLADCQNRNDFDSTRVPTTPPPTISPTETPSLYPTTSPTEPPTVGCDSIMEVICNRSDLVSICDYFENFGFDENKFPEGNWTVFAPLDSGFKKEGLLIPSNRLEDVLKFHLVHGIRKIEDLDCEPDGNLLRMVNGINTRTLCSRDGIPIRQKGGGNTDEESVFVETNLEACNGVVHIVEDVLLTPFFKEKSKKEQARTVQLIRGGA